MAMVDNMTDKERADTQVATLYDLRLQFKDDSRTNFTKDEILEILDKIASEKSQK